MLGVAYSRSFILEANAYNKFKLVNQYTLVRDNLLDSVVYAIFSLNSEQH